MQAPGVSEPLHAPLEAPEALGPRRRELVGQLQARDHALERDPVARRTSVRLGELVADRRALLLLSHDAEAPRQLAAASRIRAASVRQ